MNSFLSIELEDLDKISIGDVMPQGFIGRVMPQGFQIGTNLSNKLSEFSELIEYKFVKKYNLIYRTRDINVDCDPFSSKGWQILSLIADKNPDKMFFIIDDLSVFKIDYKKIKNVQIWPRQFQFTQQYLLKDLDPIQQKKLHWMSCILGRAEIFRTLFFNNLLDMGFEKNNMLSYGCYSIEDREYNENSGKKNYMDTGGKEEYCHLIPFNNFKNNIEYNYRPFLIKEIGGCFANIVIETFITDSPIFLTEKTFKPLVQGSYPIIIGSIGSMARLTTMGFHIPDYINWQLWDSIPRDKDTFNFWGIIQKQLLELFQKYSLEDISKDWYPYAVKNRERMIKLDELNRIEEKAICHWLLSGCHALSNPKYQYLY